MGVLHELIFGGDKETHEDGSTTERFESGETITTNADGTTRESTNHEFTISNTLGIGDQITVTRDGEGNTINVQPGWGDGN